MSDQLGPRWPAIPTPGTDPTILLSSVEALKEAMELLTGQRGFDPSYSVDNRFDTMQKTLDRMSATYSERIQLAVNQYGALAERTAVLETRSDDMDARIIEVDTASIDRDGALATSIDIVQARVDDVSAGGFFKTVAAVSGGALASMEAQVYTTTTLTGTLSAGWRVKIEAGVSYFDIYTSNWRLIDSTGTPKPVMTYSAGKFQFTADVALNGNLVVVGTITNPALAALSVSYPKVQPATATQGAGATSFSTSDASVSLSLRAGSQVAIVLANDYRKTSYDPSAAPISPNWLRLFINGSLYESWGIAADNTFTSTDPDSGAPNYSGSYWGPTGSVYIFTVPSTGTYTFALRSVYVFVGTDFATPLTKRMAVIELAK